MRLSINEILKHPWLCDVKLYKAVTPSLRCFFRIVEMKTSLKMYLERLYERDENKCEKDKHFMIKCQRKLIKYGYSKKQFLSTIDDDIETNHLFTCFFLMM